MLKYTLAAALLVAVFVVERAIGAAVQPRGTLLAYRVVRHGDVHALRNGLTAFIARCHDLPASHSGFRCACMRRNPLGSLKSRN